jgi:uncharacterized spore protein YtfJ
MKYSIGFSEPTPVAALWQSDCSYLGGMPDFQSIFEPLSKSANVKSVYGEAIAAQGKTIIPVARIAYGMGGGGGKKLGQSNPGEGEGGGGGIYATPVGFLEITDAETRFVPLGEKRKLLGAVLIGFCLGALWSRRANRRNS